MNWVLVGSSISPAPSKDYTEISPSVFLVILLLAVIFFISGLVHLLVRVFLRPPNTVEAQDLDDGSAFEGQLQQLFHLHDSGVDQSFIDTLPVFLYKAIQGLKNNPFDCAVCLCEFAADDRLRLLPRCSHAFHLECIDTWLLSHSTCPLCRGTLLPEFYPQGGFSPLVLVLESGRERAREADVDAGSSSSRRSAFNHLGIHGEKGLEFGAYCKDSLQQADEAAAVPAAGVLPVKLGKLRNSEAAAGIDFEGKTRSSSSGFEMDGRRCFSMGSFAYVLDENSVLQVAVKPLAGEKSSPTPPRRHRSVMSECDCYSNIQLFKGSSISECSELHGDDLGSSAAAVGRTEKESFSVSKIWLRPKLKPTMESSFRALSFRRPTQQPPTGGVCNPKLDCEETELGLGFEDGSAKSFDSQPKTPSFARRTFHWIGARQNKVVHSSSTSNV